MCGIVAGHGHAEACGWPQALRLTCYVESALKIDPAVEPQAYPPATTECIACSSG